MYTCTCVRLIYYLCLCIHVDACVYVHDASRIMCVFNKNQCSRHTDTPPSPFPFGSPSGCRHPTGFDGLSHHVECALIRVYRIGVHQLEPCSCNGVFSPSLTVRHVVSTAEVCFGGARSIDWRGEKSCENAF